MSFWQSYIKNLLNLISGKKNNLIKKNCFNKLFLILSEISSHAIGEIVDLLDNRTLNLAYARKVIAILLDKTNKSPSEVSI